MNGLTIIQVSLSVVGGAGALCLWLYATGRLAGSREADVTLRQAQAEKRLDDGGRRISDLTSKMLILPTTIAQVRDDVAAMRGEVHRQGEHVSDLRVAVARLEERQPQRLKAVSRT